MTPMCLGKCIAFIRKTFARGERTPPHGPRLDLLMTALSLWFVGGVYLDGWAHNHLESALETFFTPWHAVMYSGFAACGLALFIVAARNRAKGYAWRNALPDGYAASLTGAVIFAFGGVFDMFWHLTFGIEKDLEALLSPAHLVLALGAVLIVSAPFRAAWRRPQAPNGGLEWLPVVLSMAYTLSILTFMSQFAHFVRGVPTGDMPFDAEFRDILQGRSVAGYVLQSALLLGLTLLAVARWGQALPKWTFATVFAVNMYGMAFMTDEHRLFWSALASGILADFLVRDLRPSKENVRELRLFSVIVPAATTALMFLSWWATDQVWWSVHMWTGAVALSGVAGLFLSFLLSPPAIPPKK